MIYNILRNVVENGDLLPTTSLDNHVAQLFLFDFEQSGIHLPEEKRKLAVDLNEYVLHLGQRFSIGAHQAKLVNKEDLPSHIRHQYVVISHFFSICTINLLFFQWAFILFDDSIVIDLPLKEITLQ